jgi:hypothetical protein
VIAEVEVYEMNPVDPSDTANIVNVKQIIIPSGKSQSIILPINRPYKLTYGFMSNEEKNQTHDFTPASSRKRFVIRESRIRGSLVKPKKP